MSARHLATAVLALSFAGARVQGQTADLRPTLSLSLDSAVTRAVQTATPLQNAQFFARISQSELTRSYAPIIPNANVAAYRTYDAGNQLVSSTAIVPWDSRIETMGYQLSTSLNVLGGLSAYPGVRAARYALASSNYSVARTRQAVALDAEQGYLQVILDGRLVDIAQQNDSVSRQQVTQVTELVRVGKRPPADLYRSQAQESADQAAVYDAINRQRADQISLLQELHIDPEQRITLSEPTLDTVSLGARYADTAGLAVTALAQRADLEAAQAEVDARRWGIRRAGSEALPTLNAGVSVLGDGRVFDQTLLNGTNQISGIQSALAPQVANQVTTVFSLGLGYNLLNVFQSHVDVQEARVAYSAAQLGAEDVRFQVTGDVARAIGEYAVAQERLMSARSGLAAAQASFDLTSGRYDVGFSSIVDLLTAQAALAQARSLSAEAVIEVSLTKRALAFALGLDPTDRLP